MVTKWQILFYKIYHHKNFPKAKKQNKNPGGGQWAPVYKLHPLPSHGPTGQASPTSTLHLGAGKASHTHRAHLGAQVSHKHQPPQPITPPSTCSQTACNSADQGGEAMGFRQKAEGLCVPEDAPSPPFKMVPCQ